MLLSRSHLRQVLRLVLNQRLAQGAALDAAEFERRIDRASNSYDAMFELATALANPPLRRD